MKVCHSTDASNINNKRNQKAYLLEIGFTCNGIASGDSLFILIIVLQFCIPKDTISFMLGIFFSSLSAEWY